MLTLLATSPFWQSPFFQALAAAMPQNGDRFELLGRFGTAVALGLLVGLEREWAKSGAGPLFAGIRTFPSIAILGCASAMVSERFGVTWFFGAGFLGFALLVAVSHFATSSLPSHGTTTEITSLLVFVLGGMAFWGEVLLATVLTVTTVLILSLKEPLHNLARRLESQDVYATLKFAIISVVIMPLLPRSLPVVPELPLLAVLNPWKIWMIVVFVSGIGLLGYVSAKLMGAKRGIAFTGVLGGIASSTAVAASMAQRSREAEELSPQFALAVVLASTMMFPRTIVEVMVVSPKLGIGIALPLLGAALFGILASAYLWVRGKKTTVEGVKIQNPFSLIPAIKFGLLFAGILLISHATQQRFSTRGLYVVAIVGGFIDARPVALSVAELAAKGEVGLPDAVPVIMIAALSNTLLKGGYAAFLGSARMRRNILPAYALITTGGVVATVLVIRYADLLLAWLGLA